jgi:hydroxyethylthiazole kinase-like sugar kinase family protein
VKIKGASQGVPTIRMLHGTGCLSSAVIAAVLSTWEIGIALLGKG